jgi:hypothetical protein
LIIIVSKDWGLQQTDFLKADPAPPKAVVRFANRDWVFRVPGQADDLQGGVGGAQGPRHMEAGQRGGGFNQVPHGEGVQKIALFGSEASS